MQKKTDDEHALMGARVEEEVQRWGRAELPYDLAILLLGVCSRVGSRSSDMCTIMSLVICSSQRVEATQVPISGWRDKYNVSYTC